MLKNSKQLANLITLTRIIGVSFIFLVTPFQTNFWQLWVITIYTIMAFTDLLDGWVARKYNLVSDLGKILDPLADKILVLVFLPLLSMQAISALPVFIILAREFAIMALRVFSAKHGLIISANLSGKIKTGVTLPVVGVLMGRIEVEQVPIPIAFTPLNWLAKWVYSWPSWFFETLIWAMVAVTIWSFGDYVVKFLWGQAMKKTNANKADAKKELYAYLPNLVSLLNLICGIFAIFYSITNQISTAAALVLLGIVLDAVDGTLARKLNAFSNLGAKLDSKADFITFGVAPACVIFQFLSEQAIPYAGLIGLGLSALFYMSVHFRLKRFNHSGHANYFQGLPSPAGASIIIVGIFASTINQAPVIHIVILLSSLLMVSSLPYPHNKVSHQKIGFRYIRPVTLGLWFLAIWKLFGLPFFAVFPMYETLFFAICIYILSPIIPKYPKR